MYFSVSLALHVTLKERAAWKSLHGFIRICGLSLYGTSGIHIALPVENNMRQPKYFPQVVKLGKDLPPTFCFRVDLSVPKDYQRVPYKKLSAPTPSILRTYITLPVERGSNYFLWELAYPSDAIFFNVAAHDLSCFYG